MTAFAQRRLVMVDTQIRPSDVTKYPIIDAMLSVPREEFVPDEQREAAYVDGPVALSDGREICEPRSLAKMLDALEIGGDDVVLDIGCGLGYSSAVIARFAAAVVAVETDEGMAEDAQKLLSEHGADNAAVIAGRLSAGAAKHGPYDAIVVAGGVEDVPGEILDQLREGGRIAAIFMEGALGQCKVGVKTPHGVSWRMVFNATAPVLPGFAKELAFSL
ncbi:protein-L-isoaspartate O-methyltransferase [Actibacterium mucosum KCTC 23349]|uniref:Protein-L-isoaspartate O-methyltransferase n=1 Tax=Actibacterium mucosum KCTC 23349 TaxID=1454373 RepID=A0A037ZEU7_9RHOB|nr:protein-L-isoaspartate O-methyltransferase [Actibacterium mucosum]KAJ54138.1 protein-L-isoaspartate O-methyltransferase [Actibacterium mucosum KCTC 23349]